MRKFFLTCFVIGLAFAAGACGDDEDSGGGGGCARVQMLCSEDPDAISCDEYDQAPASVKECASNATTCDAVFTCVTGG